MNNYNKYLKYKIKYINLKNKKGGNDNINQNIINQDNIDQDNINQDNINNEDISKNNVNDENIYTMYDLIYDNVFQLNKNKFFDIDILSNNIYNFFKNNNIDLINNDKNDNNNNNIVNYFYNLLFNNIFFNKSNNNIPKINNNFPKIGDIINTSICNINNESKILSILLQNRGHSEMIINVYNKNNKEYFDTIAYGGTLIKQTYQILDENEKITNYICKNNNQYNIYNNIYTILLFKLLYDLDNNNLDNNNNTITIINNIIQDIYKLDDILSIYNNNELLIFIEKYMMMIFNELNIKINYNFIIEFYNNYIEKTYKNKDNIIILKFNNKEIIFPNIFNLDKNYFLNIQNNYKNISYIDNLLNNKYINNKKNINKKDIIITNYFEIKILPTNIIIGYITLILNLLYIKNIYYINNNTEYQITFIETLFNKCFINYDNINDNLNDKFINILNNIINYDNHNNIIKMKLFCSTYNGHIYQLATRIYINILKNKLKYNDDKIKLILKNENIKLYNGAYCFPHSFTSTISFNIKVKKINKNFY